MSIVALQLSTLCKININNNQRSKNLHLLMEINNYTNKGLVDTRESMFVLTTSMVKELALVEISQNVTSPFTTTCDL
jgi:RNA-binding protein YhbY